MLNRRNDLSDVADLNPDLKRASLLKILKRKGLNVDDIERYSSHIRMKSTN